MIDRVDPELIGPLEALLAAWGGPLDLRDIPAVRAGMAASSAAHASPAVEDDGVAADDRFVPGPAGEPDVAVRIYRLRGESAPRPAFLWMHPGGYVLGAMAADDPLARHSPPRPIASSSTSSTAWHRSTRSQARSRTATRRWSGWLVTPVSWVSTRGGSGSAAAARAEDWQPASPCWHATALRCRLLSNC